MAQNTTSPAQGTQANKSMRHEQACANIPNLTDEQKTKIETLKVPHMKEMQTFENKMGELKARQRTLETADKADTKAINANIDEITKVQGQMMKARSEHRQQIRGLLTDEQRVWFDSRPQHQKGKRQQHGQGQEKGGKGHRHGSEQQSL